MGLLNDIIEYFEVLEKERIQELVTKWCDTEIELDKLTRELHSLGKNIFFYEKYCLEEFRTMKERKINYYSAYNYFRQRIMYNCKTTRYTAYKYFRQIYFDLYERSDEHMKDLSPGLKRLKDAIDNNRFRLVPRSDKERREFLSIYKKWE